MKKKRVMIMMILLIVGMCLMAGTEEPKKAEAVKADVKDGATDRLAILWTSGDPEVARKMVMIYAYNAKKYGWFKTIRFIVWGPSSKLLSENTGLQDWIKKMKEIGIELYACKWCADQYKVTPKLEELGITVIYYGKPLTQLIKDGWKVLTF